MADNGKMIASKNTPLLATIPNGKYLGVHIYADFTVEFIPTVHYPRPSDRGETEMIEVGGAVTNEASAGEFSCNRDVSKSHLDHYKIVGMLFILRFRYAQRMAQEAWAYARRQAQTAANTVESGYNATTTAGKNAAAAAGRATGDAREGAEVIYDRGIN